MAKQNIYDNEVFFEGYKKIRDNKANANVLFEMPALFSLLPDFPARIDGQEMNWVISYMPILQIIA